MSVPLKDITNLYHNNAATIKHAKFKTEMCKNWLETGSCNYGKKCCFAHGETELLQKSSVNNVKYKSKLCVSYHTQMFCPYGNRCLFKHSEQEDKNNTAFYTILVQYPDLWPAFKEKMHRLPIFSKLSENGEANKLIHTKEKMRFVVQRSIANPSYYE